MGQATTTITRLAKRHPKQAFLPLCLTAGAWKVEYLLQTMSSTTIVRLLADHCSTERRAAYAALLKLPAIEEPKRAHATIPRRMGGFGLRDPRTVIDQRTSLAFTQSAARVLATLLVATRHSATPSLGCCNKPEYKLRLSNRSLVSVNALQTYSPPHRVAPLQPSILRSLRQRSSRRSIGSRRLPPRL